MTLVTFIVPGIIACGFGMPAALICLRGLRKGRAAHVELGSQVDQLRRRVAVLELQSPRAGIGRREVQLIARISKVVRPREQAM